MQRILACLAALAILALGGWTHGGRGFNGGKSQVNFNFLQSGYEYPFLNYLKTAQSPKYITGNAAVSPSDLNSDGYPTVIKNGGIYTVFFIPSLTDQPLDYKVTWSGSGTIYTPSGTISSGNASTSGFTFTPNTTRIVFGISSGTNISNLQFYYTGDVTPDATHTFGTKFKQRLAQANFGVLRFLNWQSANTTNVTTWNTRKPLSYIYYSGQQFRADLFPASAMTNSGDDYTVAAPAVSSVTGLAWDGVLRDRTTVSVLFNTSSTADNAAVTITCTLGNPVVVNWSGNTLVVGDPVGFIQNVVLPGPLFPGGNFFVSATGFSSGTSFQVAATAGGSSLNCTNVTQSGTNNAIRQPTLNVGGTGAIAIKQATGDPVTNGSNSKPLSGVYGTVVYDSALNVWLKRGGDADGGDQGISNGAPPELFLQLAIETGAHPYVVTPYLTIDPATDYMPSLATYYAANQPSWMTPRYEGINEEWNNASGFYGSRYGWNKAFLNWATVQDTGNWQGQTMSVLGQIVNAAYGSPAILSQTKYQLIDGFQQQGGTSGSSITNRVNSTKFVSTGLPSQSPYVNTAAYNWITHIATAQYMTPSEYGTNQEVIDGFNWFVTNAANPTAQAVIAASYVDTLNSGTGSQNLSNLNTIYQAFFTLAQSNWGGAIKFGMVGYEGGYSPDFNTSAVTSPVTGATTANPSVLTLATTNVQGISSHSANSGNPAVAGMTLNVPMTITGITKANPAVATVSGFNMLVAGRTATISGVSGMTQANGTWSVSSVSGQTATLVLNSSAFTTYSSGGSVQQTITVASVAGNSVTTDLDGTAFSFAAGLTATYVNAPAWLNALRQAGKNAPALQTYTTTNYNNWVSAGGQFPSMFQLGGGTISANSATSSGGVWSVLDPDIYATPNPPQWKAVCAFNGTPC